MALTKTNFAAMDNEVQPYFIYNTSDTSGARARKSQTSGPSGYFMFYQYENAWRQWWVRITLTTDGGGVKSLKFTLPSMTNNSSTWYYRLTTNSAYVCYETHQGDWTALSVQGNQARTIDLGTVNMRPNTTYYLWLYAPYGANYTGNMTFTATGTYGEPGTITANDANFGSPVNMSYGSATSGGSYTVTVSIPVTGGSRTETLQTQASTSSRSWTPDLETYKQLITDAKSVTATITVHTYFGGQLSGSRTKTITLSFTAAQVGPSLATGAFSIAPLNQGVIASMSGYIQNYSKIRATRDNSKVTYVSGASFSSWQIKIGSAANVTGLTAATYDSGTIAATVEVVCTLVDSRGFTAQQTFTATIIPYADPILVCSIERAEVITGQDGNGNDIVDKNYIAVTYSVRYAAIAPDQNSISVEVFAKIASDPNFSSRGLIQSGTTTADGTDKIYAEVRHLMANFSQNNTWDIQVIVTDALGRQAVYLVTLPSQAWVFHVRNKGAGVAFGKAAEVDHQMEIPDNWDYYTGLNIVLAAKSQTLTAAQQAQIKTNIGIT